MRTKVANVMTNEVTSVNGATPFKDVAETLIAHGVSGVPVVDGDGHVIGVVSETDLLRKEEFRDQFYREGYRPPLRTRLRQRMNRRGGLDKKARGGTAAAVMTAPALTVGPSSSTVSAARLMDEYDVKRLPVVDGEGCLVGIVSRRDLIKVFVRADADLAAELRDDVLRHYLLLDTDDVRVTVRNGVVHLRGNVNVRSDADTIARVVERVNGVVNVVNEITWEKDDGGEWAGA
jgi:CBS domain-containing protein